MRTIKIYSTSGASAGIETNVTTLGELKPLLDANNISYNGMQMVVGETKNELNRNDSVLPEGDFKLFVMPKKTKSGGNDRLVSLFNEVASLFEEIAGELENSGLSETSAGVVKQVISSEDAEAFEELRKMQEDTNW